MRIIFALSLLLFTVSANAQYNVATFSGNGNPGLTNGSINNARFNQPSGICRDKTGNLYIADGGNNCIRKIDASGNVSVYAGSLTPGLVNGKDTSARFNDPFCLCVDDEGNIYVSDFNNQCIRKIDVNRNVTTIAGSGTEGFKEGADTVAEFDYPRGIAIDKKGNLYVADSWNHRIRKINALTHAVSTYAGGGSVMGVQSAGALLDDSAGAARFYTPAGVTINSNGTLYIADAYNHRIRMIDTLQRVTTVAGSGATGPGNGGFADSTSGHSILNTPTDLFCTNNGNVLIGDTYNNRVRMLAANGAVTTVAGNDTAGFKNGSGTQAEFNFTRGITANAAVDSIWVIDFSNNAIRLITSANTGVPLVGAITPLVFPNPTGNQFAIRVGDGEIFSTIIIYDCTGRIVMKKENINSTTTTVDVSRFVNGIYFITMAKNNIQSTVKLVKE